MSKLSRKEIKKIGDHLYDCMKERKTTLPLTQTYPNITVEDAYRISLSMLERRVSAGEKIVGKKIGVTSHAVQSMLSVFEPDFGFLTDAMIYENGAKMPISSTLIQPRAEGEIAFKLKKSLPTSGVTKKDVLSATEWIAPCFEIVDSRIANWQIRIEDTIADNASCGLFLLGDDKKDPRDVDLETCGMVVEKNGKIISTGAGAAVQGSPLIAIAWLANKLGSFGIPLEQGDLILSGSLVPLEPVKPLDTMSLRIGSGIGSAQVSFV